MAKAYWITAYRSVRDSAALAAYAKLAGPALQAAGGRFLVRGTPARVYEGGLDQRIVVIEFDSVCLLYTSSCAFRADSACGPRAPGALDRDAGAHWAALLRRASAAAGFP